MAAIVQLADRLIPPGWKRIIGLTAILIALVAKQLEWVDDNIADAIIAFATLLTGVGVAADKSRKNEAIESLKTQLSEATKQT